MLQQGQNEYALCTFRAGATEQWALNLEFEAGEEIVFFLRCSDTCTSVIHLTGNYIEDDMDDDYDSEDFDEEECCSHDDENDEDDLSWDENGDEDLSTEDENQVEEVSSDEEEAVPVKPAATRQIADSKKRQMEQVTEPKKAKSAPEVKEPQPVATKKEPTPTKKEQPPAKKEQTPTKKEQAPSKKEQTPTKKEQSAEHASLSEEYPGFKMSDVAVGTGKRAEKGQKCSVRYTGKLANGKVFDSNSNGKPFTFTIGKGEVIKGWDLGVAGMQEKGKRTLVIPHKLGYGARGQPPVIPPNAELHFEVELIKVFN